MSAENNFWTERIIGTNVGAYVIKRLIGEGGMAGVFEATHQVLGHQRAIKILRPEYAANKEIREKFRKEAERMASLDHVNIPRVFDFDEQIDRPSIIMELLTGEDLNKRIKRAGSLSNEEITQIFEQILSALQYAHERGIVHRDIKPSNIYILPGNEVRILDFGISKLFGEGEDGTKTGIQIGTPVYMSPEQVKGDRSIDHRSDIYSLGVTLYCAVKGRPPYNKNTLSDFDVYQKIVFEVFPDVDDLTPFGYVINKACHKDRQLRFQTCAEWLEQFHIYPEKIEEKEIEEQEKEDEFEYPPYLPDPNKPQVVWPKVLGIVGAVFVAFLLIRIAIGRGTNIVEPIGSADSTIVAGDDSGYIGYSPSDSSVVEVVDVDTASPFPVEEKPAEDEDENIYTEDEYDEGPKLKQLQYNDEIHIDEYGSSERYIINVELILSKNGRVKNIVKIQNKSGQDTNTDEYETIKAELERALQNSGPANWIPGKIANKNVNCKFNKEFSFPK